MLLLEVHPHELEEKRGGYKEKVRNEERKVQKFRKINGGGGVGRSVKTFGLTRKKNLLDLYLLGHFIFGEELGRCASSKGESEDNLGEHFWRSGKTGETRERECETNEIEL